jgi:hypothetical protein
MALTLANMERKVNVLRGTKPMFTVDSHFLLTVLTLAVFLIVLAGHLVLSTIVWQRFSAQASPRRRRAMLALLLSISVGTYLVMLATFFPIAIVVAFSPPYSGKIEQWVAIGTFGIILVPTASLPQLLGIQDYVDYQPVDVVVGVGILFLLGFLSFSLKSRFRPVRRTLTR